MYLEEKKGRKTRKHQKQCLSSFFRYLTKGKIKTKKGVEQYMEKMWQDMIMTTGPGLFLIYRNARGFISFAGLKAEEAIREKIRK